MASVEGDALCREAVVDGDGEAGASELVLQALRLGYFCVADFLRNCGLLSLDAQLDVLGLSEHIDHEAIVCALLTAIGQESARGESMLLLEAILARLATGLGIPLAT